jgi:hypothetical protein
VRAEDVRADEPNGHLDKMGTAFAMNYSRMTAQEIRDALRCGRGGCPCTKPRLRVTHCPAHGDRYPSFGVDEQDGRLLVHCRSGCSQAEVIDALRHRGLWAAVPPTEARPRSPEEEARRQVLAEERYRRARVAPWLERYAESDQDRFCDQVVARARAVATELGDTPKAWDLLEAAANLERLNLNARTDDR